MFKREINDQSILSRVLFLTMNGCFREIQKKEQLFLSPWITKGNYSEIIKMHKLYETF